MFIYLDKDPIVELVNSKTRYLFVICPIICIDISYFSDAKPNIQDIYRHNAKQSDEEEAFRSSWRKGAKVKANDPKEKNAQQKQDDRGGKAIQAILRDNSVCRVAGALVSSVGDTGKFLVGKH